MVGADPSLARQFDIHAAALMLALSWGGHDSAWGSTMILGLFAGSAVALLLFVIVEAFAPEPILPLGLFKTPVFTLANTAAFINVLARSGITLTFNRPADAE